MKKIADSIWTSKLRYGLQLYGPVRQQISDPQSILMEKLQIAQNNMLRTLEKVRVKDKVSIKSLLEKNNMLSVNQTVAQIKLTEMWKCKNVDSYPLHPPIVNPTENGISTRNATSEKFQITSTPCTFIGDATRLWNQAHMSIINSKNISAMKKSVKMYCSTLPI